MPEGLLSGLGGIIGRGLLGGTGITAGRRAEATRKAALLKQGLDPSRMRDEAYVTSQANRTPTADIKGEFGYAMSIINSPDFKTQYTPDQQAQFVDFANTKAKGLDTLRNQTVAVEQPKLELRQQFEPVTAGLKEQATQDVKGATEPQIQADIVTSKGAATNTLNRAKAIKQADIDFSSLSKGIDDLQGQLDANPELVGAYSETKTQLGKYTPFGFSDEQSAFSQINILNQQLSCLTGSEAAAV
jgi:hypothetical protein